MAQPNFAAQITANNVISALRPHYLGWGWLKRQSGIGLCLGHRELCSLLAPQRAADSPAAHHQHHARAADLSGYWMQRLSYDTAHNRTFDNGRTANQIFAPYSDFAVPHVGTGLADGITQGTAGGDEFRTAPLMGAGERLFLLHNGRTCVACEQWVRGLVISNYQALPPGSVLNLLTFLRSL
jgi:Di-haem oxidoreductase, putative peroxidase